MGKFLKLTFKAIKRQYLVQLLLEAKADNIGELKNEESELKAYHTQKHIEAKLTLFLSKGFLKCALSSDLRTFEVAACSKTVHRLDFIEGIVRSPKQDIIVHLRRRLLISHYFFQ